MKNILKLIPSFFSFTSNLMVTLLTIGASIYIVYPAFKSYNQPYGLIGLKPAGNGQIVAVINNPNYYKSVIPDGYLDIYSKNTPIIEKLRVESSRTIGPYQEQSVILSIPRSKKANKLNKEIPQGFTHCKVSLFVSGKGTPIAYTKNFSACGFELYLMKSSKLIN
jgi:hypothetical protein